jgi:uncharacterized protein
MLVILPPSETKVAGGVEGSSLSIPALSFPVHNPVRDVLVTELESLAIDAEASIVALKLGKNGAGDVQRNREIRRSPVLPAIHRYAGVLYDALDWGSLEASVTTQASKTVAIFSALFGLVRGSDLIPAYRLSCDSKLPGGKLAQRYLPLAAELWDSVDGFVLDLRSEGYRSLSPLPGNRGVFVSLVKPGAVGSRGSLGHHNKATKGRLVRALIDSGVDLRSVEELCAWGEDHGYFFDPESHREGEIDLVVKV